MSLRCRRERSLFTHRSTPLWSCQLPRHQPPLPVCASRASCPPRALVGPISILFPVLRAEILSSARRAKAVVKSNIPHHPRYPLTALGPLWDRCSTTSPGIPSRPYASLYEYAHSPDTLGTCKVPFTSTLRSVAVPSAVLSAAAGVFRASCAFLRVKGKFHSHQSSFGVRKSCGRREPVRKRPRHLSDA
jgi:hypothetical protein